MDMITREQYMNGHSDDPQLHWKYYEEIATAMQIRLPHELVQRCRVALDNCDKWMNSIPLREWDALAARHGMVVYRKGIHDMYRCDNDKFRSVMKERGDTPTQAGMVCTLKAAARLRVIQDSAENPTDHGDISAGCPTCK